MYNFALLLLALSVGIPTAAADIFGSVAKAYPPAEVVNRRLQEDNYCVCSPTTFTFKLHLNQTCADNTINGKPGVNSTLCQIIPFPDTVEDLTPIQIDFINITENIGLNEEVITGQFNDGYEFSYTSLSNGLNPNERLEDQEEDVPFWIVLYLRGRNAENQIVQNVIGVVYNLTDCDAEPVLVGDKLGWIEVVDVTPAVAAFCPAADPQDPPGGSMSYSASFSLAHMSKASKGKATKSGKSKSGKLNHEPVRQ